MSVWMSAVVVLALSFATLVAVAATAHGAAQCAPAGAWRTPTGQRYVLTSSFGKRVDPITHRYQLHAGTDLAMLPGPGPVLAASAGTVVRSGPYYGLGNEVTLRHPGGVETLYGHMSRITVHAGEHVDAGQQLGVEGSTGQSTGNHLHFEVHVHGAPVNPVPFMAQHGVPLDGTVHTTAARRHTGGSFALPAAGRSRRESLHLRPLSIPATVRRLYHRAAARYGLPWTLLAGVGMEETAHGRNNHRSSAGARGLMQFMPATFAAYGVDGDHDGRARITDDADSIFSAAHLLVASGAKTGPQGVRDALYAYNHANWYVNDVLYYAHSYGGATVDGGSCRAVEAGHSSTTAAQAARWARSKEGGAFRFGADGPHAWDSSSFVQSAYAQAGVKMPRTAQAQRNWLAHGHGIRVAPGHEQPGDLIFQDSYLGTGQIGFVELVVDSSQHQAVAARNPRVGVSAAPYADSGHGHHIFEIWRVTSH